MPWTVQGVTIALPVGGYVCEGWGEVLYEAADVAKAESCRDQIEGRLTSPVMTVEEVANYLKVTVQTIYSLLKLHKLPAVRSGREWRFNRERIDALFWVDKEIDPDPRSSHDEAAATA